MSDEVPTAVALPGNTGLQPDNAAFSAGSAGGVAVIINWSILFFDCVPEEQLAMTLAMTPTLGMAITWIVTYFWRGWGRDPERVKIEKGLQRCIKKAKQDMKDPRLSDEGRVSAARDYERAKEAQRSLYLDS